MVQTNIEDAEAVCERGATHELGRLVRSESANQGSKSLVVDQREWQLGLNPEILDKLKQLAFPERSGHGEGTQIAVTTTGDQVAIGLLVGVNDVILEAFGDGIPLFCSFFCFKLRTNSDRDGTLLAPPLHSAVLRGELWGMEPRIVHHILFDVAARTLALLALLVAVPAALSGGNPLTGLLLSKTALSATLRSLHPHPSPQSLDHELICTALNRESLFTSFSTV